MTDLVSKRSGLLTAVTYMHAHTYRKTYTHTLEKKGTKDKIGPQQLKLVHSWGLICLSIHLCLVTADLGLALQKMSFPLSLASETIADYQQISFLTRLDSWN